MRDLPDKVMLFAAGRGQRMAPLTDLRPKPMVEVAGRPLIDHALALIHDAGITRVVANTHYLPEAIEAHLARIGVETLREQSLLETGGGLRNAMGLLGDGPVITQNSDAIWTGKNPILALLDAWRPDRMDALLVLIAPENATGHTGAGDFSIGECGRLQRAPGFIYSGLQVINPDRLDEISQPVFSLNKVWDLIASDGRLYGIVHDGGWCDVGRPSSISLAEEMLDV